MMKAPRGPVERVIDAIVAVPLSCASVLRQLIPIGPTRLERRIGKDVEVVVRYAKGRVGGRSSTSDRDETGAGTARAVPQHGEQAVAAAPSLLAAVEPDGRDIGAGDAGDAGDGDGALAIEGYDQLSARQVVDRLAALTADEIGAVARYEQQRRRRQTILQRIAQLT